MIRNNNNNNNIYFYYLLFYHILHTNVSIRLNIIIIYLVKDTHFL